jgi:Holliday junction resolvase RusA-like endonuclease
MSACVKCGHDPEAFVGRTWMFHVDRDPPSLNQRIFNVGGTHWQYKQERDAWQWEFRAVRLLQKIAAATTKRRVTLTRCYDGRQKERDVDNLAGGMKCCVDALVREGLLVNDNPQLAELHYAQHRGGPRGLMIYIEELV